MSNKDRVYRLVIEKSKNFNLRDFFLHKIGGITTAEIGEILDIARANVSSILNELVREEKVIKIISKPVYYVERETFIRAFGREVQYEISLNELERISETYVKEADFSNIVGYDGSLKEQIEQAKAAVIYPPHGLHTLVIGPAGSGKTYLAESMYKFAQRKGLRGAFEVLNCADYYHNPQLLLSHLFGHVKGAYTGAYNEKIGLVEKADNGILFLDEVHRLPPEGQEMLFYLMDKGIYKRLGDTEERKANIMIIAATTEKIDSILLKTFIRRIPVIIQLPSFDERPLEEKLKIILYLIKEESKRLGSPIIVPYYLVYLLSSFKYEGNIGELKSLLQLMCSKAFLINFQMNRKFLKLDMNLLPAKYQKKESFTGRIDEFFIITPLEEKSIDRYDLYEFIASKYHELKEKGMGEKTIREKIFNTVEEFLDNFELFIF
ncbi:sigma 54-interacting transcriptional regulator [Caldanaerobacter sp.]|uniref:sigma 54-interacting transcriptional regulator n=1 Tax=Caldanaerobacter sp. TaxID=2930036 RepID=UPI003C77FC68